MTIYSHPDSSGLTSWYVFCTLQTPCRLCRKAKRLATPLNQPADLYQFITLPFLLAGGGLGKVARVKIGAPVGAPLGDGSFSRLI